MEEYSFDAATCLHGDAESDKADMPQHASLHGAWWSTWWRGMEQMEDTESSWWRSSWRNVDWDSHWDCWEAWDKWKTQRWSWTSWAGGVHEDIGLGTQTHGSEDLCPEHEWLPETIADSMRAELEGFFDHLPKDSFAWQASLTCPLEAIPTVAADGPEDRPKYTAMLQLPSIGPIVGCLQSAPCESIDRAKWDVYMKVVRQLPMIKQLPASPRMADMDLRLHALPSEVRFTMVHSVDLAGKNADFKGLSLFVFPVTHHLWGQTACTDFAFVMLAPADHFCSMQHTCNSWAFALDHDFVRTVHVQRYPSPIDLEYEPSEAIDILLHFHRSVMQQLDIGEDYTCSERLPLLLARLVPTKLKGSPPALAWEEMKKHTEGLSHSCHQTDMMEEINFWLRMVVEVFQDLYHIGMAFLRYSPVRPVPNPSILKEVMGRKDLTHRTPEFDALQLLGSAMSSALLAAVF